MPSGMAFKMGIKWKRFRRWLESDSFKQLVMKAVAVFVILLMVLSIFTILM